MIDSDLMRELEAGTFDTPVNMTPEPMQELKRFYVTKTWDDWPEGGSCGEVIEAEDHDAAEAEMIERMITYRIDDRRPDEVSWACETEQEARDHIRSMFANEWHTVDCFELDDFIAMHTPAPEEPYWKPASHWDEHPDLHVEDWMYEVADRNTRLGYHEWVNHQLEMVAQERAEAGV